MLQEIPTGTMGELVTLPCWFCGEYLGPKEAFVRIKGGGIGHGYCVLKASLSGEEIEMESGRLSTYRVVLKPATQSKFYESVVELAVQVKAESGESALNVARCIAPTFEMDSVALAKVS